MKQIKTIGNLPNPIRNFGLFSKKMTGIWEKVGYPEIWECSTPGELGKEGHLDDCEFQVLIDKDTSRYYLVAMSVDPDRVKAKVEDTEFGDGDVIEDTAARPATIVYYVEINSEEFRIWQHEDRNKRITWLRTKAREEELARVKAGEIDIRDI